MELNLKKVNEEKVNTGDFQPVPQNRYNLVIEAAQEKQSQSGNPMIEVTMRIDEGQNFANRKLWDNFSLSEKAQIYLVKLIQAAGVEKLLQEETTTTDEVCRALVGKTVSGFVKITNSGSKPRNEVSDYTAVQTSGKSTPAAGTSKPAGSKSKLFS